MSHRVTIVVATWNRPDALRAAVRSAIAQTVRDWRMLVIGDSCDERTGAVLDRIHDDRVAYVNLPRRFGEQAGPNSIGMALADSPFLALLNHDDVWLPDHLERALAALGAGADLYLGRAARADETRETTDGPVAVFSKQSPRGRRLRQVFTDVEHQFEPASAWAFRSDLLDRVGPWRLAREAFRTPADDWLLRAWRAGVRTVFDEEITVLHLITHYRRKGEEGCYEAASPEHDALEELFRKSPLSGIRAEIEATARSRDRSRLARIAKKPVRALIVNPVTGAIYRATGLDANSLWCRLRGKPRGHVLSRVTKKRTGRELPEPPTRETALAAARAILAGRTA